MANDNLWEARKRVLKCIDAIDVRLAQIDPKGTERYEDDFDASSQLSFLMVLHDELKTANTLMREAAITNSPVAAPDKRQAEKGLRNIAKALLAYAEVCDVGAMNIYARPGTESSYYSGFAINGDELLFSFQEIAEKGETDA